MTCLSDEWRPADMMQIKFTCTGRTLGYGRAL